MVNKLSSFCTNHDVVYRTKTLAALLIADLASFDTLTPSGS